MPLQLREATVDDIPGMTRVGVDAFENDEINIAMFPHGPNPTPDRHWTDRTRWRAGMVLERMIKPGWISMVVVDEDKDGQVVGYAQWTRPAPPEGREAHPPSVPKEAAASLSLEIDMDPPSFDQEKLREFRIAQDREEKRVCGEEKTKNVWYLVFIAVDPAYQGSGVGRMLVQWGIEKAKAEGKGLYLSATPAGKPFYTRLGLEEVGGFEIWGIPQTSFVLRS